MLHPPFRSARRRALALAAAAALALLRAWAAQAAAPWEPYPPGVGGPWGGSVYRLVLADPGDPDTAWAATSGGVFRWDGRSWEAAGFRGELVYDLAVCEGSPPARIFAALGDGGLWRSSDAGGTWEPVLGGKVKRVAVSADCSTVWAAEDTGGSDCLRRSSDLGTSWDRGPEIATVNRMAPGTGGVWLATASGLYRWTADRFELVLDSRASDVSAVGETVAVASGDELWLSTDAGENWEERHAASGGAGLDFGTVEVVAADENGRILYWVGGDPGALLEIDPQNKSPATVEKPEEGWVARSLVATTKADWLGAAKAGAYRRDPGERTPSWCSQGMAAFFVGSLAFAPDGSGRLAVGGGETGEGWAGVLLWDPDGERWSRAEGLPAPSVAWVGYRGSELWASVRGFGLYRSKDGGATWEERTGGVGPSVAQDPGPVLAVPGEPDRLVAGFLEAVYTTDTAGALWERVPGGPPNAGQRAWQLALLPPAEIYAVAPGVGGDLGEGLVYRSDDGGGTWGEAARLAAPATAVAAAPRDSAAPVLVGTENGLWILTKSGVSRFQPGALPKQSVSALAVDDRADPARMAVAFQGGGVWVSEDGGGHWEELAQEGLLSERGAQPLVAGLAFEPGTDRIVAGSGTRGLVSMEVGAGVGVSGRITATVSENTLSVDCQVEGAQEVGWSLDGATWTWGEKEKVLTVTLPPGDGGLQVFVRFRTAGGTESPTYQVLAERPDVTPPAPEVAGLAESVAEGQPITVTVTGEDVVEYRYRLDDEPFPDVWSPRTTALELGTPSPGSHTLELEVRDEAGNVARLTRSFTVGSETSEPTGGGTVHPAGSGDGTAAAGGGGGGGGCFLDLLGER